MQQGVGHQLGDDEGDIAGEGRVSPLGDETGGAAASEGDAAEDGGVVEEVFVEDGGGIGGGGGLGFGHECTSR
ncbi:hypothetical protein AQJ91_05605 [Streptomyces dysideae]|uniref:Uncharacterized protein n=1 Tax=Streptomyces dysideae TaxID=909626 RepID=A0A101V403_9ACTN|nr:hypothetical protein AQJ91_05605 [Streptomyces dysideae]